MRPDDPYANPFEIGFAGNWLADDVDAVLHAASAIARALVSTFQREDWVLSKTEGTVHQRFSAATVFNQIYGGVTFSLSSEWEGDGGAWAFTNNGHLVTVYSAARGKFSYQNAAHEFGHAFARHVINPTIKPPNENRQPYLDVGAANIKYIHPDTKQVITLGTGNNRTNRGYATAGLDWQQNTKASDGEEFADMFLGWAFNHFAGDAAGAARYNWMSTNMADWLTQANQ
jgi:hypothetical protein